VGGLSRSVVVGILWDSHDFLCEYVVRIESEIQFRRQSCKLLWPLFSALSLSTTTFHLEFHHVVRIVICSVTFSLTQPNGGQISIKL